MLLGRIQPEYFPHVFGPNATEPLDANATRTAFEALARDISATGDTPRLEQIAAGFLRVAVERMANAIKQISVQRGHDVTRFALCCFGGAGGQHAAQVAEALGIQRVIIHPLAGVLSAYGIGVADVRVLRQASVEAPLDTRLTATLASRFERLAAEALAALREQGADAARVAAMDGVQELQERALLGLEHRLLVKVAGADTALPVAWNADAEPTELSLKFRALHERHFGFRVAPDTALVVESLELEAVVPGGDESPPPATAASTPGPSARVKPIARRDVWCADGWRNVPVYDRARLPAGARFTGPALVVEDNGTTIVEPGWRAEVHATGTLLLARMGRRTRRESVGRDADPIMLEVFNNLFMHVAEEMGIVLEHTAHSVNIKERLDFSCALFAADGSLIANAPHMPVHLGSMGDSVQSILRSQKLVPGDAYLLNTPYNGGTHLPDLTVVTPVFDAGGRKLRCFVASRAHHADIGGSTPGSMPPTSRTIDEEGVLFDGVRIVADGELLEREVRELLAGGPFPARNPDQNIADLKAQLAANARGVAELDAPHAALRRSHGHALHAARSAQRHRLRAPGDRRVARRPLHGRARRGRADQRRCQHQR